MSCYHPLTAWYSRDVNPSGKRSLVFNPDYGASAPIQVSCGRCIGCRLEYSRQWAVRCVHEASLHSSNSFLTLTFSDEYLPSNHSVCKRDLQLFFKRLRKRIGARVSYFACGEYGDLNNRPHYHVLLFGYDFPDKYLYTKSGDFLLYRSNLLESLWPFGHCTIGEVTFESCAYVARYVMKKYKGDLDDVKKHYRLLDRDTGEVFDLEPEFCLASRNPAIGKRWFDKFRGDTDKDFITLRGVKMALPSYYDYLLEQIDPVSMADRKVKRVEAALERSEDNTLERLNVREKVKVAQLLNLKRGYEK